MKANTQPRRLRPNADERFRRLIDEYNTIDWLFKELETRRKSLQTRLRNIIRRRGRGVHNGHESSINAYDVKRRVFKQDKARELMPPAMFNKAFGDQKFIQIDGGPLVSEAKELPNLGPPVSETKEEKNP